MEGGRNHSMIWGGCREGDYLGWRNTEADPAKREMASKGREVWQMRGQGPEPSEEENRSPSQVWKESSEKEPNFRVERWRSHIQEKMYPEF